MNRRLFTYWTTAIPTVVGVAVYFFWYFGYPQVLLSQEQSQLFVWDMTYLHDRLEMPGGWGDYLWSAVVQFFCSPMQGALTMALLCAVLQMLSMWLFHRLLRKRWRVVSVLLSLILPMLLCIKVYKPVGGTLEELEYDYLLRLGKWEGIVAKNQQSKTMILSCQNGMYAQLYIASIDAQGNVTKPFLLPQQNPREFYREMMHSYNVPDFTKTKVEIDAHEFREKLIGQKHINVTVP